MHRLISKLVIYRNMQEGDLLRKMARVTEEIEKTEGRADNLDVLRDQALECVHELLDIATRYGFDGDLWHGYLALILAMTETPFTLVSEKVGAVEGTVNRLVTDDLLIFRELFDYDLASLDEELGTGCFGLLKTYKAVVKSEQLFNKNVSTKVAELASAIEGARTGDELYRAVTDFYGKYGVGELGLNKAFRIADDPEVKGCGKLLIPITNTGDISFEDLIGYDAQKRQLMDNTEAFLAGRPANNVLLYGDAGTGKSSSVKALLNRYYMDGLRMIEIYRHQFRDLPEIAAKVRNRNYRFILFMDDLSFEEFETDYKYLKAVIEGGIEPYPDNLLVYATSNRRHLIRETAGDRYEEAGEDMHLNDTMAEKLSLSARFGLQIGYFAPTPAEYDVIVKELAKAATDLQIPEDDLIRMARAWEIRHGGFSGRAARQFVDHLTGVGTE